ncbi:MAG: TonB-dependent receptor [Gallionella sp.]
MITRLSAATWPLLVAICASPLWCRAAEPANTTPIVSTEQPYFEELPMVLSVTRLRQSLADAPAAVTVIDSDFIRRSGARDINELFRLTPGFLVGNNNGAHPLLYYHGVFEEFPRRLKILVDGRSIYLPILLGEVEWNAVAFALEDIERIEVIRGSNSASYGDVAFLGMLNIITRHTDSSHGASVSASVGNDGIRDGFARYGWGKDNANFRLSFKQQRDHGLGNSYDDRLTSLANFRADFSPTFRDELMLSTGISRADAQHGYIDHVDDPADTQQYSNEYVQVNWQRLLDGESSVAVSASHSHNDFIDEAIYPIPSLNYPLVNFTNHGSRDAVSAQHTFSPVNNVRLVWGGELRQDMIESLALSVPGTNIVNRQQGFANAEWRVTAWLLLNAGGLREHDNISGNRVAPRLAANFHLSPTQTVRAGVSKSFRAPSILERTGDLRWWNGDVVVVHQAVGNPNFAAEWLLTRELSYLADMPDWHLRLDVRAFHERISGLMRFAAINGTATVVNGSDITERGIEYQADWKPYPGTRFLVAQTFLRIQSANLDEVLAAPTYSNGIGWFQDIPGQFQLSVMRYSWGAMTWQGKNSLLEPVVRTDLRLAHSFRIGGTRGEASLMIQNLDHQYQDFVKTFFYEQRVFVNVRLDY